MTIILFLSLFVPSLSPSAGLLLLLLLCSQAIFAAVAFYLKHLGVKTRAVDSKKSRGGFFRRPLGKTKKEESSKSTKPRGGFGMPSWIAGSAEVKPNRKLTSSSGMVSSSTPTLEISECLGPTSASSPDADDGGDVSPVSLGGGLTPGEPFSPCETPTEETPEKDSLCRLWAWSVCRLWAWSVCRLWAWSVCLSPVGVVCLSPVGVVCLSPVGVVCLCRLWASSVCLSPVGVVCLSPVGVTEDKVGQRTLTVARTHFGRKVGRSESACMVRHSGRQSSSRAKKSRSRSDVDLQPPSMSGSPLTLTPHPNHLLDGPALVPEGPGLTPTSPSPQPEELEPRLVELEQDPANWRELANPIALASLSKEETKRQEVINELYTTEHAHSRMLTVLQTVFCKPLEREDILNSSTDENWLKTIFPSLDEIIEMHYAFHENLKKLRVEDGFIVKSIGATLLNRFGGPEGEWFQKLTSRFCSHQSWEAESKPQCRRLQLKDIIPIEMQRLTKYPLLLENIAKSTEDPAEKESIQQSAECCRKILNHVNEEVKVMENLLDYQRRLDTSGLKPSTLLYTEYKNIDLTQRIMIYEGPLTWKVTKEKAIEVQCVLLGDMLVLLQRQDDKMVLKCQSKSTLVVQEGGKQMLSPIITLGSAFLREVATERNTWTEVIKKAMDDLKQSRTPGKQVFTPGGGPPPPTENGTLAPLVQDKDSRAEDESPDPRHSLIDYLSDKGFDLIGHSNTDQEKLASGALDEVMSLKRLLVGSISLSEDCLPDEENDKSTEEAPSSGLVLQVDDAPGGAEGGGAKEEREGEEQGGGGISAPLVLSQERMKEVLSRLLGLEESVRRLQTMEEDHHKLQEALSKFSLEGGNFQ
ncbi:hypothetical protein NHX12_001385 [Muraenolepis orangiensis]|uniref:DH domain-containing protein n=1 Tax=Muraenolepis orangiensis TaxID=630683 RepID=A0A9Q0E0M0_9TELE|nr:hypothetical protein NHX12_001385 [Muraenolepis orangiensis]